MAQSPASLWTIDELGAQVALALSVDYAGPPNDRIREVPDRRTIRYYTTLGLIDRPAEMRGRTARYGRRHLLQLVAIKRLQARGLALSEIQQQLLGQSDAGLQRLARVPNLDTLPPVEPAAERRGAFWTEAPAPVAEAADGASKETTNDTAPASLALQAVPLQEGVLLLFEPARSLDELDLAALRITAAPLLKLLETRRLLRPRKERGIP